MTEYILSNEEVTVAVNLEDGSWRVLGVGSKAFWFEWDTGKLQASFNGKVQHLEDELALTDDGTAVTYEVETPGAIYDVGQVALATRLYVEINTRGQNVTPALILSGGNYTDGDVVTLPVVNTALRETREIPLNYTARVFGVRLTASLTQRVDLYGIEMDVQPAEMTP